MDRLGLMTLTAELQKQGKRLTAVRMSPPAYSLLEESRFAETRAPTMFALATNGIRLHVDSRPLYVSEDSRLKPQQITLEFETTP